MNHAEPKQTEGPELSRAATPEPRERCDERLSEAEGGEVRPAARCIHSHRPLDTQVARMQRHYDTGQLGSGGPGSRYSLGVVGGGRRELVVGAAGGARRPLGVSCRQRASGHCRSRRRYHRGHHHPPRRPRHCEPPPSQVTSDNSRSPRRHAETAASCFHFARRGHQVRTPARPAGRCRR